MGLLYNQFYVLGSKITNDISLTSYNGELPSYFGLEIRKRNNILDDVWYTAKYFVFLSNSLFEHVISLA